MRVFWTTPALSDLGDIATYIADDSPAAATRILSRIASRVKDLTDRPHRGRIGAAPNTRELVVDGTAYIVIYRIESGGISILAVFHGARERPDAF